MRRENQLIIRTAPRLHSQEHSSGGCLEHGHPTLLQLSKRPILRADIKPVYGGTHHKKRSDNSHGQSLVTNRSMLSECSRKYVVAGQPPLVSPGEGGDRTRGNKSCQLEPIIVLFELRSAAADSHRSAPRLSRVFWAGFP